MSGLLKQNENVKQDFEHIEEVCKQMKDKGFDESDIRHIEMAWKLYNLFDQILDEALALDVLNNDESNLFDLKFSGVRNYRLKHTEKKKNKVNQEDIK